MSFFFSRGVFRELDDDLEVCPDDGLLNPGLVGTRVDFEITSELEIQESDESSHTISSYTSLSNDAQMKLDLSESCPVVWRVGVWKLNSSTFGVRE